MKPEKYLVVSVLFKIEKYFCKLKIFRLYSVNARQWKKMVVLFLSPGRYLGLQVCQSLEKFSHKKASKDCWCMFLCNLLKNIHTFRLVRKIWKLANKRKPNTLVIFTCPER